MKYTTLNLLVLGIVLTLITGCGGKNLFDSKTAESKQNPKKSIELLAGEHGCQGNYDPNQKKIVYICPHGEDIEQVWYNQ